MNLAELFIRRPIATTLVMLAILIGGIAGYRLLPVSDLPNVDFPTILVSASLPGANPDTMASSVATPLERQFSTIAGLDSMSSVNALGITQITLQFNLSRDIDAAAQDVQAAIAKTASQLPPSMPTPPTYQKVNPADQPILFLSLNSPTLPLSAVDEYAETLIAQRISMVSGVAQVGVLGSQKYAVRVQLDPGLLASRGIGIDEVSAAVQKGNVNLPTGTLWGRHQAFTVEANGQLTEAAAYRPLIVAYRNGSPVRLQDLGRVIDSVENDKIAAWYRDRRSIILAVQRQPGTNTVEVVDAIKQLLPTFRAQMPASVNLDVLFDRSRVHPQLGRRREVHPRPHHVPRDPGDLPVPAQPLRHPHPEPGPAHVDRGHLRGDVPARLQPRQPVAHGPHPVRGLRGGRRDRHAREHRPPHGDGRGPASRRRCAGSREIGFTILSMTLSLAAVFLPVLFMGGLVGRLLHEFAVTIAAAILVSGFVSLTLTPMLCSRFLRPPAEQHHGRLYAASERAFQGPVRTPTGGASTSCCGTAARPWWPRASSWWPRSGSSW